VSVLSVTASAERITGLMLALALVVAPLAASLEPRLMLLVAALLAWRLLLQRRP